MSTGKKDKADSKGARKNFDILEQDIGPGNSFLIEASAGTGKTFNIQHLYLRLILERDLKVGDILAVTFTEAATAELRSRIRSNLEDAKEAVSRKKKCEETLERIIEQAKSIITQKKNEDADKILLQRLDMALFSFDEAGIFTIHGFCGRMLNENAFESRIAFDLELIENQDDLLWEIATDFWRKNFYGKNDAYLASLDLCGCTPGTLATFAKLAVSRADMLLVGNDNSEISKDKINEQIRLLAKEANSILHENNRGANIKKLREILDGIDLSSRLNDQDAFRIIKAILEKNIDKIRPLLEKFKTSVSADVLGSFFRHLREDRPLEARKLALRLQSYDDMLLDLRRALRKDDGVTADPDCNLARRLRTRYKAAMIDEFQDTDPVQCEIFETIFRHPESLLVMIGDPKQSIYGFRSADIYSYLRAKYAKGTDESTLTRNFRSVQELLDGVNELFSRDNPFFENRIQYDPVDSGRKLDRDLVLPEGEDKRPFRMDWIHAGVADGIAKSNIKVIPWTASQVVRALNTFKWKLCGGKDDGKIEELRPKDIAILVPWNRHASEMRAELKRRGVPAVISDSGNVFSSEMAIEICYILRAMLNPGNSAYLKTALGGALFRFPDEILCNMEGNDLTTEDGRDRLGFWADRFREFRDIWERKGVMPALTSIAMLENIQPDSAEEQPEGSADGSPWKTGIENLAEAGLSEEGIDNRERNLVDLRHLMELLHRVENEQSLSPALLVSWLARMIAGSSDEKSEDDSHETRLETDLDAVRIMTVHKAKGLQFPVVFCPNLWENNFSLDEESSSLWPCHIKDTTARGGHVIALPVGGEKAKYESQARAEALGELLRVAYVAATRAQHYCQILYGNLYGDSRKTALAYLLGKIPENAVLEGLPPPPAGDEPPSLKKILVSPVSAEEVRNVGADRYVAPAEPLAHFETYPLREGFQVPKNWGILSYSKLTRHRTVREAAEQATGGMDEAEQDPARPAGPAKDKAEEEKLPGGPRTGSCFHEIMQEIDVSLVVGEDHGSWSVIPAARELIEGKMRSYGLLKGELPESGNANPVGRRRYELICEMIHRALTARIPGSGKSGDFSFNGIERRNHISEMGFLYEINGRIDTAGLRDIARSLLPGGDGRDELAIKAAMVNTGMMTGSIDLLFRRDRRFFFADWKTNTLEGYDQATLRRKMFGEAFILQFLIYSLVLDLYLRKRVRDYDFKRDFGGGYYVFVRGLSADGQKGIFFNCISQDTLERLKLCIRGPEAKTLEVKR